MRGTTPASQKVRGMIRPFDCTCHISRDNWLAIRVVCSTSQERPLRPEQGMSVYCVTNGTSGKGVRDLCAAAKSIFKGACFPVLASFSTRNSLLRSSAHISSLRKHQSSQLPSSTAQSNVKPKNIPRTHARHLEGLLRKQTKHTSRATTTNTT